jgi:AraC family transcriptional regulator
LIFALQTSGRLSVADSAESGTRTSVLREHRWLGISSRIVDVYWDAEPGWVTWSFERPALCLLREEIGGRGELRSRPDTPSEGEYFGTGHLTLLPAGEPLTLYATSLRQAQLACFLLDPRQAGRLTAEQVVLLERAPGRLMFKDERLRSCAQLLSDYEGDYDAYAAGLSRALLAALIDAVSNPSPPAEHRLTGARLAEVLTYIVEHLDQILTNEPLARRAQVSPTQFGHAFREATGLSPQRWQMDARVRHAQRLMLDKPPHSLSVIAMRSGFADQSHFSRAFLDIVGSTPTAWLHRRR